MERPRVLVADDHAEFVTLVARLIDPEFEVVKTFADGQTLVDEASAFDSELVVLDISMPGLNGIEAAVRLRAAGCNPKVVFLTVHEDLDYLRSAVAAGALGYVIKRRLALDLLPALRAALAGRRFVSAPLSQDPNA